MAHARDLSSGHFGVGGLGRVGNAPRGFADCLEEVSQGEPEVLIGARLPVHLRQDLAVLVEHMTEVDGIIKDVGVTIRAEVVTEHRAEKSEALDVMRSTEVGKALAIDDDAWRCHDQDEGRGERENGQSRDRTGDTRIFSPVPRFRKPYSRQWLTAHGLPKYSAGAARGPDSARRHAPGAPPRPCRPRGRLADVPRGDSGRDRGDGPRILPAAAGWEPARPAVLREGVACNWLPRRTTARVDVV